MDIQLFRGSEKSAAAGIQHPHGNHVAADFHRRRRHMVGARLVEVIRAAHDDAVKPGCIDVTDGPQAENEVPARPCGWHLEHVLGPNDALVAGQPARIPVCGHVSRRPG